MAINPTQSLNEQAEKKRVEQIVSSNSLFEDTRGVNEIIGSHVLAKNGHAIGKVVDVQFNAGSMRIEGLLVRGDGSSLYVGMEYISKITPEAVFLNVTPTLLLKGKRVLSYEGKAIGTVAEVIRKEQTNEMKEIIVKSFMRKDVAIPSSAIRIIGKSIMLQRKHHVRQRYIWQRA